MTQLQCFECGSGLIDYFPPVQNNKKEGSYWMICKSCRVVARERRFANKQLEE